MIKFLKRVWKWILSLFVGKNISVKPTGSVSILNTTSAGIQPIYEKTYNRKI